MKLSSFLSLLLSLAGCVSAASQASLLAIDIERGPLIWPISDPDYARYPFVNIQVGTPPQPMKMLLAITVGDISVVNSKTSICGSKPAAGSSCSWGLYNQSASNTSQLQLNQNLTANGGLSWSPGFVVKDLVTISNRSIADTTVVVQNGSVGWFGIGGYSSQELVTTQYSNIPILLNQQKNTSIIGYSIYLQRINATDPGRIVFGGVETAKFSGPLESLSIPPNTGTLTYGNITSTLTNMTLTGQGKQTPVINMTNVSVIFDPSYPGMNLPQPALLQLMGILSLTGAQDLSVTTSGGFKGIMLPYNALNNDTTIDLQFKSTWIHIPIWDLFLSHNTTHGYLPISENSPDSKSDSSATSITVGSSFFSNAYSVFDFSHNQLSVAPLKHDALSGDNIIPISDAGVSGLMGYQSPDSPKSGLSNSAKAGVGAGVGVGVGLLLVIAAVWFFLHRRRRPAREVHEIGTSDSGINDVKSLMHSGPLSEDTDPSSRTRDNSERGYSPAPTKRQYGPVEMEAPSSPSITSPVREMPRVKRKPVAPQELP